MASSNESPSLSSSNAALLEKARTELNENPATRNDAILQLKESILSKEASADPELEGVEFERKDDPFLLRFLRARKFDPDRSLDLYINYYRSRHEHTDIFNEYTPQSVEELLKSGAIAVLENAAKDGAKVVCIQPRLIDFNNVNIWHILRMLLLTLDKLIEDEEVQINGVRMMINYDQVEFMRVLKFSQSDAVKNGVMPKLLQDAMPIRLKGIHLLKQPWYISIVLGILKSFMKEKMRDRISLHGYDMESLHNVFNPDRLPSDFDGPLPLAETFSAARLFSFETQGITQDRGLEQDPVLENNNDDVIDV